MLYLRFIAIIINIIIIIEREIDPSVDNLLDSFSWTKPDQP